PPPGAIGAAERVLEEGVERALARHTFGRLVAEHGEVQWRLANARAKIRQIRLLVLHSAHLLDTKASHAEISESVAAMKLAVPRVVQQVADDVLQVFGAAGVSQDTPCARVLAGMRSLRLADGPDEVHARSVAFAELLRAQL
ncbi:MAG: hypothetical protein MHM6MM_008799, partial [Cercozoa sp. M6MM]